MKELSTEKIEVGGIEYTLFLNRKGIITWEKVAKLFQSTSKIKEKLNDIEESEIEVNGNENPYELYTDEELGLLDNEEQEAKEIFVKFYWIALYENHKLGLDKTREWFEQAEKEYGLEQLVNLSTQMVEDVNAPQGDEELKKLPALRPKKAKK